MGGIMDSFASLFGTADPQPSQPQPAFVNTLLRAGQPGSISDLGFKYLSPQEAMSINPAMAQGIADQMNTMDATQGELGVILHPDGQTWSHEVSTTIKNPMGDGWVNIPTLVKGQSPDAQLRILAGKASPRDIAVAARRAVERVRAGANLPTYPDAKTADNAAQAREEEFWRRTREGAK